MSEKLDSLQQILSAATQEASQAMGIWTGGEITLSLEEVVEAPLEEIEAICGLGDELLTMVVLTLEGKLSGTVILAFDEANGRELAAILTGQRQTMSAGDALPWTKLEESALQETGNILGCAYINAISRLIEADLVPSPPYFLQDFGTSVIQQSLYAQALITDQILVCRTKFARHGKNLNWHVLFVPNCDLRDLMASPLLPCPC